MNSFNPANFAFDPVFEDDTSPAAVLQQPVLSVDFDYGALQTTAKLAIEQLNERKLKLRADPTLPDVARQKELEKIAKHERFAWALLDELTGKR